MGKNRSKHANSLNGGNKPKLTLSIEARFHIAIDFFSIGNFDNAKILLNEILIADPRHAESWFYSALIADNQGLHQDAIRYLESALEIDPQNLKYLYTVGDFYYEQNYLDQGVKIFELIISIKPEDYNGYYNLAGFLHKQKKYEQSLLNYHRVLELHENNINAIYNIGTILIDTKKYENAVQYFQRVIETQPNSDDALNNLGFLYLELNGVENAIEYLNRALSINPNNFNALNNLGKVQEKKFLYSEALENFVRAIKLNPDHAGAYSNRAAVLSKLNQFEEALANVDKALLLNPNMAEAYSNRGNALKDLNRLDEALASYARAIEIFPNYVEAYTNRGVLFGGLLRHDEAIDNFNKAILIKNDFADAYWNKALSLLRCGDFKNGLNLYEWRWKVEGLELRNRSFTQPLWLGNETIKDKTILLHAEQGLGDTIQFCRYVKLVKELGARVLLEVPKPLFGLLNGLEGVDQLVANGSELPEFDYQCPLMSLPLAFKTTIETIPTQTPYIQSNIDLQNKWRGYLGDLGFKVAICWQGSKKGKVDIGRSFPVSLFEEISKIDGVRLISLQKNDGLEQLKSLPKGMRVETLPDNFDRGENSFLDSAAVMKCVDLVITSDTALTHLGGALNVKAWLPLKFAPDWRWMLDRNNSPWYPNHRLFRQTRLDDWTSVFKEMEYELKNLVSTNRK